MCLFSRKAQILLVSSINVFSTVFNPAGENSIPAETRTVLPKSNPPTCFLPSNLTQVKPTYLLFTIKLVV